LKEEPCFPLILHYDFNDVIKPRCEILKTKVKSFNLRKAFLGRDGRFCHTFKIEPKDLEEKKLKKKAKKTSREEKDKLWMYVDQL